MKVYISGKVTGNPSFRADFAKAENKLKECNWTPVNPVAGVEEGDTHENYMRRDLKILLDCDAIYLMRDWENSKGAKLEKKVAEECGLIVIYGAGV